jgi:hypothetical protein
VLWWTRHGSITICALFTVSKIPVERNNFSRAMKLLMSPSSQGPPRLMNPFYTESRESHFRTVFVVNSGPLSLRM